MSKLKRPAGVSEDAVLVRVWVDVRERGIRFKFHRGAGIGIRRDNPAYFEAIGEWFCTEVEALSTSNTCRHRVEPGRVCAMCEGKTDQLRRLLKQARAALFQLGGEDLEVARRISKTLDRLERSD